jgi:response regulator RpfG family c-di-GMP phosphodiesterase
VNNTVVTKEINMSPYALEEILERLDALVGGQTDPSTIEALLTAIDAKLATANGHLAAIEANTTPV